MAEEKTKYDIDTLRRENAALRKYAAIQKATEEKIGCQSIYVDIAGSLEAAFVLDELIFFTLPRGETGKSALRIWKDGVLWMAVRRAEWWNRKRLTAHQADGAVEKLVKQNLIFKQIFKFNAQPTVHLRLNVTEFFKRYGEELEKANPPENQNDTITQDLADLYEMMGVSPIPNFGKAETESPKAETESPIGDFLNSPDSSLTKPINATPSFDESQSDIGWMIAGGKPITEKALAKQSEKQEFEDMIDRQLTRLGLNFSQFTEDDKMRFRKFITAERERGRELCVFVDWWLSDDFRRANTPWKLDPIRQQWLKAFGKVAESSSRRRMEKL